MINSIDKKQKLSKFLNRVESLFTEIKQWLNNTDLIVIPIDITISEQDFGEYHCNKLIIKNKHEKEIAQIIPIGASILGANGRVDIKGLYDNVIISDFKKGGPKMMTIHKDKNGNETVGRTHYYYRGIDQDGWYWIEDKRSKGHLLDSELFFDLLAEVSDYEIN